MVVILPSGLNQTTSLVQLAILPSLVLPISCQQKTGQDIERKELHIMEGEVPHQISVLAEVTTIISRVVPSSYIFWEKLHYFTTVGKREEFFVTICTFFNRSKCIVPRSIPYFFCGGVVVVVVGQVF